MKFHYKISIFLKLIIILILLSILLPSISCFHDRELLKYTDSFVSKMDHEVNTIDRMTSDLNDTDWNSEFDILSLKAIIPVRIQQFSQIIVSFQEEYLPNNPPQELKQSVSHAIEGTEKIIAGLSIVNSGLEPTSTGLITTGITDINDGVDIFYQAINEYETFADDFNEGDVIWNSWWMGILIGTGLLWGSILLVINPITKFFTNRRMALQSISNNHLIEDEDKLSKKTDIIYGPNFIIVSVVVLGLVGFLFGLLVGTFFIGIAWKPRYWPGIITLIGLSFLGSFIYGIY